MVLTEFNEEVFRKGMREEGFQEGFDKGVEQGQNALADAIKRIREGATVEDLINDGFDKKTAELAWNCK